MFKFKRKLYPLLVCILLALVVSACGDSTATPAPTATVAPTTAAATPTTAAPTPAPTTAAPTTAAATTVAATTARATTAAAATTAASSSSSNDQVPIYTGASTLVVPDTIKAQFTSAVGSTVKNPQVAALSTPDSPDKVKAFYTDYLTKNGWKDAASVLGTAVTQIESAGGFALAYEKGNRAFVVIGFPAALGAALGFTDAPTSGTIAIGFTGEDATPGGAATSTTVATSTTAAASATTATASGSSDLGGVPSYPGAKVIQLPDSVKTQFESSVGSNIVNPQVGAFVTSDASDKIKTFYTDYFKTNGWIDATAAAGSAGAQIEQLNGFFLVYAKGKQAFVVIGLPAAIAAGFGVSSADIPSNGTLVMGFSGETK